MPLFQIKEMCNSLLASKVWGRLWKSGEKRNREAVQVRGRDDSLQFCIRGCSLRDYVLCANGKTQRSEVKNHESITHVSTDYSKCSCYVEFIFTQPYLVSCD